MDVLKRAVHAYAIQHRNRDGLAMTPVTGLTIECAEAPQRHQYAIVRPLVVFVLQGTSRMVIGREQQTVVAGQSAIVRHDMRVVSNIENASRDEPYLAVAIEIEMTTLSEVAAHLGPARPKRRATTSTFFVDDAEASALDCVQRLLQLWDRPAALSLCYPGILKELYCWLLLGRHGYDLRALCDPASHANRLAAAIAILRAEYRTRISPDRLAAKAGMGLSAFHMHFKRMITLSPGQYQKRLRLIEARRLMLDEGASASSAAFEVGYESVSQFTREYGRLFNFPPKRDALRTRSASGGIGEVPHQVA